MPALLAHEGTWSGTYRVVDLQGETVDTHESCVECVFPDVGPFHYVQRNRFTWSDGKTHSVEFGGVLRDTRIFWDTDTFTGYGWTTRDNVVLLTLDRKDVVDASFTEIIVLGKNPDHRARTWHWFRNGLLYQRTLCDERRSG
jgi:hypothetical protein